ncbi:MAG TPA: murein biosynthesis integral membrane protein MurJ [Streptosporangiaceae bacterium]|nr:murein biosynthesis integral membrane protein MurJ [Streptosporangiaceae bacterium]
MSTPAPRAGRNATEAAWPQARGRAPGAHRHTGPPAAEAPDPGEFPTAGGIPPGPGDAEGPGEPGDPGFDAPGSGSVVRSSSVMALGTIASRGTGFLRTLVLAYALGVGTVSIAYNNANTLPNTVYDLMLGGILTSIVVPLLVNASKRDADGGQAYDQRTFTLATMALFALTVIATLAASLLVSLYAHSLTGPERHLTVIFAYFFIPQIFFYGMSSLAGGVLNARGHFAAPMWTPVINNIVVIAVLLLFIATGGIGATSSTISAGQVQLLGFGTTLGIVAQTAALIPFLRRVGFRWRPRFDFRRAEVAEIRRMAGPLFGYILTTQVSFLVVQNVANAASNHVKYDGFPAYSYAWQLFQMPYAIVGISVITALLPRMSAHASEGRYSLVKSDFSSGVRLSSVIVAPAALILAVLGPPLAEALFGYGSTSVAEAHYIGVVFGIFSLGLVPYMMFQLMLRVFYAMHDSRTPMYIGVAVMATNVAASLLALAVLPAGHVVEGVAAAFGLANVVGTVLSWVILSRRLHGLAGRQIAGSLIRMHLAAIPGLFFVLATSLMVGVILSPGPVYGIVTIIIGGGGALLLYLLFARALGITELTELTSGLRSRLGR